MNPNRSTSNLQGVVYQYTYNAKKASWVCLQNTFDYSPFGAALDGRTIENDFYRRGFNGMEKDDEVKGSGNSYTTHFRQLDPRVGRWFSIDPEVNRFAWSSGYLAFSNCPIVMIDPNGNTDYYNSRGKWIASDGIKNNEVRMALKSKTARAIIKDMKANKVKTLGEYNQKDIVQVPGDPVLKEMGRIWGETTSGKTEYVMAVGSLCDGQESFATLQGTEKDAPAGQAIKKLKGYGYSALYTIHTHPLYSESSKDDGSGATVSTPDPSMGDVKAAQSFEDTEPLFHNNGLQSIVIGPTYHYVDKESSYGSFKVIGKEKVLKRGEDMISFYNHTNTTTTEGKEMNDSIPINTTMKPNASISYKKFMKAAQRANNDENQRNNN
jgi:RHS repeat-associated protein